MPASLRDYKVAIKIFASILLFSSLAACGSVKTQLDEEQDFSQSYDGFLRCVENCQLTDRIALNYPQKLMIYGDVILSVSDCSDPAHVCFDGMLPFAYPRKFTMDQAQWSVGQLSFEFEPTDHKPIGCDEAADSQMFLMEVIAPPKMYPFDRYRYLISDRFGIVELQAFACTAKENEVDCRHRPPQVFRNCTEGNFLILNSN